MITALERPRHHYLEPPFAEATAFDVMHAGIVSCPLDTTLAEAARGMAANRVHALVIENLGAADPPWHLVSAMDITRAASDSGATGVVSEIASEDVVAVAPDTPLRDAARMMADRHVPHLVVVHGGRPIGIVSTIDVVRAVGRTGR